MRMVSATRLKLTNQCPGWATLPPSPDRQTVYSERGHGLHEILSLIVAHGKTWVLTNRTIPEDYESVIVGINDFKVRGLAHGKPHIEPAFAYNPETDEARILGYDIGRDYFGHGLQEGEIPGTADVVFVSEEKRTAYVIDWKTGYVDVEHPRVNWQIKLLATAAQRVFHVEHVVGIIAKVSDVGNVWYRQHRWREGIEVDGLAASIQEVYGAAHDQDPVNPTLVVGPQCKYCPVNANCSAFASNAQLMVPLLQRSLGNLTPELASELWTKLEAHTAAAKVVHETLLAYGEHTTFTLPDGRIVRSREVLGNRKIMGSKALPILLKHAEVNEIGEALTMTQAGIKRALGNSRGAEVIRDLESGGAMRRERTQKVTAEKETGDAK